MICVLDLKVRNFKGLLKLIFISGVWDMKGKKFTTLHIIIHTIGFLRVSFNVSHCDIRTDL